MIYNQLQPLDQTYSIPDWAEHSIYTFLDGKEALGAALQGVGCNQSDKILVPALFCQDTASRLVSFGYDLIFCDVNDGLTLDMQHFDNLIDNHNIKAVIVVCFFGVCLSVSDQQIEFLRHRGISLVGDFAHSCFAHDLSNPKNFDAVCFSLRKNFSTFNGGIALFYKSHETPVVREQDFFDMALLGLLHHLTSLTRYFLSVAQVDIRKLKGRLSVFRRVSDARRPVRVGYPISCRKSKLLGNYAGVVFDPKLRSETQKLRKKNYRQLAKSDVGFEFSANAAFSTFVPQFFIVDSFKLKTHLLDELKCESFFWPGHDLPSYVRMNRQQFPRATSLAHRILCVPCSEQLSCQEIEEIRVTLFPLGS